MRKEKALVLCGIVLVVSGLMLFSVHGVSNVEVNENLVRVGHFTGYSNASWNIARHDFVKGENLSVGFIPGSNWALPPHDNTIIDGVVFDRIRLFVILVYAGDKILNFTELMTSELVTELEVTLICPGPETYYDPSKISAHPRILVVRRGSGLITEGPTDEYGYTRLDAEIGGVVTQDGTYVVTTYIYPSFCQEPYEGVNGTVKWKTLEAEPPTELVLYRISEEKTYPYMVFLEASPVTIIVGVITFSWGFLKEKRLRIDERRRLRKKLSNKSH